MTDFVHDTLPCGIEYAVCPLPRRKVVCFQLRVLAGMVTEPADKLGLMNILSESIDKGTENYTGQQLADALDVIGASSGIGAGRETITFSCTVLPEHLERIVELQAELLRRPTFPENMLTVNLDLAKQELSTLEDDASGLSEKMMGPIAFGPLLGRHPLGEVATLDAITRQDLVEHWKKYFHAGNMLLSVAGDIDPQRVSDVFEKHFSEFGSPVKQGREAVPVKFTPQVLHRDKKLEQEQISICWPGVDARHEDFPAQQVMLGILSGGMSSRLFTEVREKQGLVYWVSAWQETPRGSGMIFLGASTTPERCDKTFHTLLHEVNRLADDITQEELDRTLTGILASQETRGDSTRSHSHEIASDLFFHGRPISPTEKADKFSRVTIDDIQRYLATHPRDKMCVVTLGPKALQQSTNTSHAEAQ